MPNRTPANDGRRRVARWRWLAALTVLGGLCLAGYELLVARRATPIVATLRDGSQTVQVLANGDVRGLAAVSPTLLPFVRSALTTGRLTPAQPLPHLPGARSTPVRTPQLFEPCFTHVSTDQPTFRWQGARQATSYVVRVFAEEHTLLIESETLTSPQWCPPEPLPRGRVLAWEVGVTFPEGTTVLPNRPLLRPALRVLSEEEWDHYQAMASTLRDSHLAWGTYLVQAGLLDEALREFQSLRADNPHEPLAQQLLAAVNALRHAVSDSEPQ